MNYQKVIYRNYPKSNYPSKLAEYLKKNHFSSNLKIYNKLLDIGCGDGTYVKEFKRLKFKSEGIDKGYVIRSTGQKLPFTGKKILEKERLPYTDNNFDFIFTKSTIEHISNTEMFLSESRRVLKVNGRIFILTPAWEYNYKWFYDDPTHIKPFHRKGLQDALLLAGFKNVEVKYFYHLPGMWRIPQFKYIATLIRKITPDCWRWRDKEETKHNLLIRFSKEVQLIGSATK